MSAAKVRTLAPAKVNWTLEVLGRCADGYHDIATVLQTVDVCDRVTLTASDELRLRLGGRVEGLPQRAEDNLAFQAAVALRQEIGRGDLGALIEIEKVVAAAAGLGGGSSDAAAVLRGLNALWGLGMSGEDLAALGARLGSDVPFFVHGGTAQAGGRGEDVTVLPDAPHQLLLVVSPPVTLSNKTAQMYGQITPDNYSDGRWTSRVAARIRSGVAVREGDVFNVFELVISAAAPAVAEAMGSLAASGLGVPHLAGSGPGFFLFVESVGPVSPLLARLRELGCEWSVARTLRRDAAVALSLE